jgi:ABC-type transport system substrate-binding protein
MRWIPATREALAIALAAAGVALFVAPLGCQGGLAAPMPAEHGEDAAPVHGGTLRLASFGDVRGLDPAGPIDGLSMGPIHLVFAGLVDYDLQGHVVPDLADHWDVADDGRTYRFVLRHGVTMHDGSELGADDVKRSVERALQPTTPDLFTSYFAGISGYAAFTGGKAPHLDGVVVEGRDVVSFHLDKPDATFLFLVAMHTTRPTCKSAGSKYEDTWLPCGAGPFKLPPGGWQRGTGLRLVRHDAYFRPGLPYLDAVEWTYNMQAIAQRLRFEHGDLDVVRELTHAESSRFVADPRWRPFGVVEADTTIYGESMNTRMPPFDNVEIRRAVAAAIDRQQYALIQPTTMAPMTQAIPRSLADYDPGFEGQRYDLAAALEHMRKAGYPFDPATGKGGWPEPVEYTMFNQGLPSFTAQILQQDLARIGLRVHLKMVSYPAFLALQERAGASAMSQGNWMLDYPDPSAVFDQLFSSSSIAPEGSVNTAFYSSARLDAIIEGAHREMDPVKRKALYREANTIVCDEAPWAFTYGVHWFTLRQPYVRGLVPHPVWPVDVSRVWIDRAEGAAARALGGGVR